MTRKTIQAPPPPDRLLTVQEVALALRLSTRTVRRYLLRGLLPPPIRFSSQKMFWRESTLRRLIEARGRATGEGGAACQS